MYLNKDRMEKESDVFLSLQIAAPDNPDDPDRMVIITGPPEAQFKVKAIIQSFRLLIFRG